LRNFIDHPDRVLKVRVSISVAAVAFFLVTGLVASYWSKRPTTPQSVADQLSVNLASELAQVKQDAQVVQRVAQNESFTIKSRYPYFIYEGQKLIYWSDNVFVPSYASIADASTLKLLKSGSSDYLAGKFALKDQKVLIFVVPLYRKFNITNEYLSPEWNRNIFPSGNITILDPDATIGVPVCVQQQCPFRISFVQQEFMVNEPVGLVAVIFLFLALVLFVLIIFRYVGKVTHPAVGFLVLYAALLALRYAMIRLNFPAALMPSDLFDPQVFSSSTLNASLGDLILNELAVLVLCLYLFTHYQRFQMVRYQQGRKLVSWLLSIFFGLGVLFAFLFPFVVIQTLFNNSSITLDISQSLQFDSLRLIATLAVLLACSCSFLFAHVFIRLLIGYNNPWQVCTAFLLSAVLFGVINESTGQPYLSSLLAGSGCFLIVYWLKLYASLMRLGFATFAYLFTGIFFLSANSAYSIYHFGKLEKISNEFRFASDFLIDRDDFGEYLLQEIGAKIARDAFIQTRLSSPFLSRDVIRQKIRQVFLPGYFNKYDVEIFLFNASGEPLDNRSPLTFSELISEFDQDAYRTAYEGVYFVNSPGNVIAQRYLVNVPIKKMGLTSGHIVLALGIKRVIPESVYPELLVDNRSKQIYRTQDLSYAVFTKDGVLYSAGTFNYEQQFDRTWLGDPALHTRGLNAAGYYHIAQEDENGRVAVVSSQRPSRTFALSNFSFFMVLGLAITLVFLLIQGIANYWRGDKLYFSARIQLFLNLAFFLPLIIVSITTLSLTNRFSQNQLNEEYLNKARSFGDQVAIQLNEFIEQQDENTFSFENRLTDLAKLTGLDANVYNREGILMATTQPQIIENNLISPYINRSALQAINRGEHALIETEQVGRLKYFVSYAALKAPSSGELLGVVGIPFFRSGISLEKVQVNIFINILNIFTLIFIALVLLSYFVSKWLTFPLTFITQSLRKTSLTKTNQPLVWKADDEIGLMVREYNQMLFKLSESKAELEQTQRERAWREIAQQVAHEIKNPLTPMKLSLQQMERAIQAGTNSKEKTEKAITSLLTQVDTLNEIASSFSSFAKMPEPVIQRLELVSLVKRIVDLHSHSGELIVQVSWKELYVMGDEQLLGRTFSNIILNAFQAAVPGRSNVVNISIEKNGTVCRIIFSDNGKGIEAAIAERIFVPYFTTKKSGSGLGLAIAKQAIEHMKGRIWFETRPGTGTTFFIELPGATPGP
jgi:two-component system nitrogen regulation sensor histidine kinase NtrY